MFSSISIRFTIDEYESCVQYIFSTIRYLRIEIIDISITIQTNIYYFLQQQIAIIHIVRDFTGIKPILNITRSCMIGKLRSTRRSSNKKSG